VREGGGWWLLRASNTEDALTLRCEAPDEASLQKLTRRLAAQLEASGLQPPVF
jgi:phosphomannomutase